MCGIAGLRHLDGRAVDPHALEEMAAVLLHRGPDEQSVVADGAVGFAHTRLSIIDVGGSHQPMDSADGRWTLVFNGEVFNYRELRRTLDYPFATEGDTEVVLAGLVIHGLDFVRRLRGQFAFVAHDRATRSTHLVRDPLGVLPLYYRHLGSTFAWASEIKALYAGTGATPVVDAASLDAYLSARSVPSPYTLFEGVTKLPPGSRAVLSPDGRVSTVTYWMPPPVDPHLVSTAADAVDAVDAAVRDAVRAALVADVPVGAYLSGGVDSSLIAAVMQELRGDEPIETFSAGFGDPRHDELPWAALVSRHLGTRHHEVQVRPTDFEDSWSRLTWHRDAPMSEPADVAVHELAVRARRDVTVVLSGEGGDELFAGYPKYRMARALSRADLVPAAVRRTIGQGLDARLSGRWSRARIALRAAAAPDESARMQVWFAPFTPSERRRLLPGVQPHPTPYDEAGGRDPVDRMLRHDLRAWLPDNLLERGDRMSMAASLELRPPLLDHRLVELAFRLPSDVKVRHGVTKWVLKEVARRYLPAEVVDRRKVGFRVPLDDWFRVGLRDSVRDRLTGRDSFVGNTFDRQLLGTLLDRHDSGRFNEEARLWTLMSLEVWHETFFRQPARTAPMIGPR